MAVIKTIDLVGVSTDSWRDAASKALEEASKTLRGIEGFDVLETSAVVAGSEISEYHTHVRIRFRLERQSDQRLERQSDRIGMERQSDRMGMER